MRLLIVEDDPVIADQIARSLRAVGHQLRVAATGAAALLALRQEDCDAIVLDRMLPDLNGLSVIDQIRRDGLATPILMLSALGSVKDRIEGLASGADDYLAKPFDMDELAARIAAIARRGTPAGESARLEVGRLRLDPSGHQAWFRGQAVTLNRRQYSLLAHLMRHADRLVTRSMLLEAVWGYAFAPTANIVESNLSRLRTALIGIDCDPIETQRGAGYILRSERCA
ncbi:DNA-binding response regulator [Arthrobacter sp. TPD3018]|uniref:response regulator transcription factor n=1 Tax=Bacteria TaxID=2 RepID=UPI000D511F67|nr:MULTISPECIES: response regulator transcription factor [Bacteria]PVE53456.1 DNA-binding response regulator [Sphingomonas sp. TPD3009]PVE56105.1 DNA-binding response regulator [Arthrobacter sp. TPD3018]PVE81705.1 DNA-binding response regulator [Sphingomonas melonis]